MLQLNYDKMYDTVLIVIYNLSKSYSKLICYLCFCFVLIVWKFLLLYVNVSFNICSRFCCSFEADPSMKYMLCKVFQKLIVLEVVLGIVKQVCRIIIKKYGEACCLFSLPPPPPTPPPSPPAPSTSPPHYTLRFLPLTH